MGKKKRSQKGGSGSAAATPDRSIEEKLEEDPESPEDAPPTDAALASSTPIVKNLAAELAAADPTFNLASTAPAPTAPAPAPAPAHSESHHSLSISSSTETSQSARVSGPGPISADALGPAPAPSSAVSRPALESASSLLSSDGTRTGSASSYSSYSYSSSSYTSSSLGSASLPGSASLYNSSSNPTYSSLPSAYTPSFGLAGSSVSSYSSVSSLPIAGASVGALDRFGSYSRAPLSSIEESPFSASPTRPYLPPSLPPLHSGSSVSSSSSVTTHRSSSSLSTSVTTAGSGAVAGASSIAGVAGELVSAEAELHAGRERIASLEHRSAGLEDGAVQARVELQARVTWLEGELAKEKAAHQETQRKLALQEQDHRSAASEHTAAMQKRTAEIASLNAQLQTAVSEREKLQEHCSDLRARMAGLKEQAQLAGKESQSGIETYEKQVVELQAELARLNQRVQELTAEVKDKEERLKADRAEILSLTQKLLDAAHEAQSLKEQLSVSRSASASDLLSGQTQLAQVQAHLESVTVALAEEKKTCQGLRDEIEKFRAGSPKKKGEPVQMEETVLQLETELGEAEKKISALTQELEQLKKREAEQLKQFKEKEAATVSQLATLERAQKAAEANAKLFQEQLDAAKTRNTGLQKEAETLRSQLKASGVEVKRLQDESANDKASLARQQEEHRKLVDKETSLAKQLQKAEAELEKAHAAVEQARKETQEQHALVAKKEEEIKGLKEQASATAAAQQPATPGKKGKGGAASVPSTPAAAAPASSATTPAAAAAAAAAAVDVSVRLQAAEKALADAKEQLRKSVEALGQAEANKTTWGKEKRALEESLKVAQKAAAEAETLRGERDGLRAEVDRLKAAAASHERDLAVAKEQARSLSQTLSAPATPAGKKKDKGASSAASTPLPAAAAAAAAAATDEKIARLERELTETQVALKDKTQALENKNREFNELRRRKEVPSVPATPASGGAGRGGVSQIQAERLVTVTREVLALHAPVAAAEAKDSELPDSAADRVEWATNLLDIATKEEPAQSSGLLNALLLLLTAAVMVMAVVWNTSDLPYY